MSPELKRAIIKFVPDYFFWDKKRQEDSRKKEQKDYKKKTAFIGSRDITHLNESGQ
jgi:hypothetical protein